MPGWARWDKWARSGQWGDGGGVELVWLLYDTFTTDDAAPITSPRTCEPGPGTLTAVETNGATIGIASGVATLTGSGSGYDHCTLVSADLDHDAGLACGFSLSPSAGDTRSFCGWDSPYWARANTTTVYPIGGPTGLVALAAGETVKLLSVFRNTNATVNWAKGYHAIADGKLVWVDDSAVTNAAGSQRFECMLYDSNAVTLDDTTIIDLPANGYTAWDADFSTVTDSKSSPANGTSFDCDADSHASCTFTYETGKDVSIRTRYTDGNNHMTAIANAAGGLVLWGRIGGQYSSWYTGAGLFSDGVEYQIDIVSLGSVTKLYLDNVLKTTETIVGLEAISGGQVDHTLATNDIELETHPYPSLGIATDRVIAPQTTDTFTHTNDFLAYIRNVTLPAAGSTEYFFRITGSDEITLQLASDGSLALLDNATSRITAGAATISDGDDVALICEGANGEVFVAGTSAGATAAIAVTTGTAGKRLDAQTGIADAIELFPRDVSSMLPKDLV